MINRHVFTGRNAADAPILVGMELQLKQKQVELLVFVREGLPEEFTKALTEIWEKGEALEFPVEPERLIRSAEEEHLLPMELKADRPEVISRLQNEWTLKLLSYKLYESIGEEINGLQQSVQELGNYSQDLWDKAKKTWDQVGNHAQDFNLSRNHATELRDRINKLFEQLKKLREGGQAEFEQASSALREQYEKTLEAFQGRLRENPRVNELFDQLKSLQKEIKEARLTHRDRRTLWKTLDDSFEFLKNQKENLWQSHLGNRIHGLEDAMRKIQSSIDRDRANIDFEARKLASGRVSQLEQQLRATRMKVMEDRIKSKEEKLTDMQKTLQSLKKKEASQRRKHEQAETDAAPSTHDPEPAVEQTPSAGGSEQAPLAEEQGDAQGKSAEA
jgi:chromosome segregation ATPase